MNINALHRSDVQFEKKQVLSLQIVCISCIVEHLDEYSTEHLSLLPTKFRRQLLTCLPPLDILKLEDTSVVSGLDMNEVWHVIAEHYAEANGTSVLPRTFNDRKTLDRGKAGTVFYETIEGDWRATFLTRTLYILLHTFSPSSLSDAAVHSSDCCRQRRIFPKYRGECSCWVKRLDPLHHDIIWRLAALPFRSEIARHYSLSEVDQNPHFSIVEYYQQYYGGRGCFPRPSFHPKLIIPNRYANYLTHTALELLTTLLRESRFKPKVLAIDCVIMQYSELCQHFLGDKTLPSYALLADLISDVECLEFVWTERLKFDRDASVSIIMTILGALLNSPSPKLTSLSLNSHTQLDDCILNIAPFFSAQHYTEASKSRVLPISIPYTGLKNLHIFGCEIAKKSSAQAFTSVILHQSCVEGIEVKITSSLLFSPDLLLVPIQDVIAHPQLQFFVCEGPWKLRQSFETIFLQFLSVNPNAEIFASTNGHAVILPASNSSEKFCSQKVFTINLINSAKTNFLGIIFSWLQKAQVKTPLKLVKIDGEIDDCHQSATKHYLSHCKALNWYGRTDMLQAHLDTALSSNQNLETVKLSVPYPVAYLKLLPALFGTCPQLKELSLGKLWFPKSSPHNKLEEVFECLVSCPYPKQLTVDLRDDGSLGQTDIEILLKAWERKGHGRKLRAVLLKNDLQTMVAEMVLKI